MGLGTAAPTSLNRSIEVVDLIAEVIQMVAAAPGSVRR